MTIATATNAFLLEGARIYTWPPLITTPHRFLLLLPDNSINGMATPSS